MKRLLLVPLVLGLGFLPVSNSPAIRSDSAVDMPVAGRQRAQTALQHEVTVTLKLVQVYVTDKKGNPIPDLAKEEFLLDDNGAPVKITGFEKHDLALPASPAPALEPVEPAEPVPPAPAPLLSRKFLFLFDFVFTQGKGFRIAREAALRFIETGLAPADEAAVLSFGGGRNFDVRKFLTRDRGAVRGDIESMGIRDLLNTTLLDDEQISGPRIATGEVSSRALIAGASARASPGRMLAGNFIWAMKSLAQVLRYVPGQKHIILYSTGIKGFYLGRGEAFHQNTELGRAYKEMCREMSSANVSIFPISTTDPNPFNPGGESATGDPALREMAAATGGHFLGFAVNAAAHMEEVNSMTGTYYVLGYPVSQAWDGKYHTIRVKVTRPGCEVHAQPGYFNPKPFPEYSTLEKQIHLIDLALAQKPLSQDPVRFEMQALPAACAPPGNILSFATVRSEDLGDVVGAKVEAVNLVFNSLDQLVDSRRSETDLTAGGFKKNGGVLFAALAAEPGTYNCRIVLRNLETGRAAVAGAAVTVPKPVPGKTMTFPPVLMTEVPGIVNLGEGEGDAKGRSGKTRPARESFIAPDTYAPYLGQGLAAGAVLLAAIRCAPAASTENALSLAATLTNRATGGESAVSLSVISQRREKAATAFLVRFEVPKVEPGSSTLSFAATDRTTGLTSRVARAYRID